MSNTSGDADQLAWEASYNDPSANVTMVVANRGFSPTGNPFLFTGRRLDAETGLYFYRFRTYHPTLKTFIQRDPLGYVDSASLYQYVGGRPTAAVDPLGLRTQVEDESSVPIPSEIPKGSVGTIEEFLTRIRNLRGVDPTLTLKEIAKLLRQNIAGQPRYVYIEGYGWVDMVHFLFAAYYYGWTGWWVWPMGLAKEIGDLVRRDGFMHTGDWAGNQAGVDFFNFYWDVLRHQINPKTGAPYTIWEALEIFLRQRTPIPWRHDQPKQPEGEKPRRLCVPLEP
ncbi:MAG: RHS repeat-associated core domain-containing protein [Chloroflexi bacterium]|nr:MAG: RHS repeat-associated core domain-containing protein [Chloroflexota bacterium]